MNFKKDLSLLSYICPTGVGRIINIKNPNTEDGYITMFMSGQLAITTKVFSSSSEIKEILEVLNNIFIKDHNKFNDELIEEWKEPIPLKWESFFDAITSVALASSPYSIEDFNRYDSSYVYPENEFQALSIDFMKKMWKIFKFSINYYFTDKYIIGRCAATEQILFITSGYQVAAQLSLIPINEIVDTKDSEKWKK